MSTSSSISLAPPTVTAVGLHGTLASGEVVLWEDVEQTGLTVQAIGVSPFLLELSASGTGSNGWIGVEDDIDLAMLVAGTGAHGGLGVGEASFVPSVTGGGTQTSEIRLAAAAVGVGAHGGVGAGEAWLRAHAQGQASGTHEHGTGAAHLRMSSSGVGALGSVGSGSVSLLARMAAQAYRGSVGTGTAALAVSASASGWADGTAEGEAGLQITMRTGATGFGAVGWSEARNVGTGEALVMTAETRALSRYAAFPLNSVAVFQGRIIGAGAAGIALLDAEDDDGADIEAYLQTGDLALDDEGQCRVPQVHVEYRSLGPLEVTVTPDGLDEGYVYRLEEARTDGVYRSRVKVGRGIRASRASLRVANVDGAGFTLRSIEIDVEGLGRKVS